MSQVFFDVNLQVEILLLLPVSSMDVDIFTSLGFFKTSSVFGVTNGRVGPGRKN